MPNPVLTKEFGTASAGTDASLQSVTVPQAGAGPKMTMGSVVGATFLLLILVGAGAWWGWNNAVAVQRWYLWFFLGLLLLVILTVANPKLAPLTGIFYSLGQGAFLGSVSRIYEEWQNGIVPIAVVATLAVFLAMLLLYVTRIIKVTEKVRSVIIIATAGIALFYLFTWLLSLFSGNVPAVFGTGGSALVFSVIVIAVAALNLLLDFEVIERGVAAGAPRAFSWFAAFGLMVTIVWLYIEILRMVAIVVARRS